ncbi:MAG: class I SAM-dependent methyltransferase [Candidatus Acidiferrales bacterium]
MGSAVAEFDAVASNYEQLVDGSIGISGENSDYFAAYKARYVSKRVAGASDGTGLRILDYGCGVGLLSSQLKQCLPQAQIDGFDVSENSLSRVELALRSQGVFTSRLADIAQDYGIIILANVLHHVNPNERPALISQVASHLAPGGKLAIFEHNPLNPLTRWAVAHCPFDEGVVLLAAGEVGSLLASGLEFLRRDYIVFFPKWLSGLRVFESFLNWCPAGAQHVTVARKAG